MLKANGHHKLIMTCRELRNFITTEKFVKRKTLAEMVATKIDALLLLVSAVSSVYGPKYLNYAKFWGEEENVKVEAIA